MQEIDGCASLSMQARGVLFCHAKSCALGPSIQVHGLTGSTRAANFQRNKGTCGFHDRAFLRVSDQGISLFKSNYMMSLPASTG